MGIARQIAIEDRSQSIPTTMLAAVYRGVNDVRLETVPVPVIDPLVQLRPVSTGVPAPLRLTAVEVPVEELLVRVSVPVAAPAAVGSKLTDNAAV